MPATLYPSSVLFTYHHFRKCLQRGFQLVCRRQGIWEVHGSRQKQQRGGDLLVEMQLQPLPESNTTLQRLLQICSQTYILRVSPLMPFLKSPDGQTSTLLFTVNNEKCPHLSAVVVTWPSCSLSRSSVTPRDLIPLTRHAACTSFTFRLSTPSSAIS